MSKHRIFRVCPLILLLVGPVTGTGRTPDERNVQTKAGPGERRADALPLKPERKVEFATAEGTWISLDVSPDGKTILFELLGHLYTVPITGGQATRLTNGMQFDSQPRYSPSGSWITFVSDRDGAENLWIARADGSEPKQLTQERQSTFVSPAWSADGEYVLVSRRAMGLADEIWMYHIAGGAGVQITKVNPQPGGPAFQRRLGVAASPDGRFLYYARFAGGAGGDGNRIPNWQIARRDLETGDQDVITEAFGRAARPWLCPGGTKLVYGTLLDSETGLRIRDLASGAERWLKHPVQRGEWTGRASRDILPGYAFTPDGKELVLSYAGKIHRVNIESGAGRIIPFTAEVARELGASLYAGVRIEEGPVRARVIQDPAPSPDGKSLAFSAFTHLYKMDVPGGAPARLTSGNSREFQPAWSPDGRWIAYVTWTSEGGHIWKVSSDGVGAPSRLTNTPGYYRNPAWSPDGARIVAQRAPYQPRRDKESELWWDKAPPVADELVWAPANGGEWKVISPARNAARPHFTRDPGRIYLYSPDGLISVRFDGTDRRTHLRIVGPAGGAEPRAAEEAMFSPDARHVLALVRNQVYVAVVPRLGGEPLIVNVVRPATPARRLTTAGADYIAWTPDGSAITWALGSTVYRVPLSSLDFTKPAQKPAVTEFQVAVERPRQRPSGTILLRGARVITMRGEEVIADADIVVKENRIVSVGRRGSVPAPSAARIMDLTGSTIMPGIIDAHAHWFEIRRGVLDVANWPFLANLAYGVTTGRDAQTETNDLFVYQDLVEAGEIPGPRAFSTGPAVYASNNFQSFEDTTAFLSRYSNHYRTHLLKSYIPGNRQQRQWIAQASRERKLMPTTEGASDMKLDLTQVIDGFTGHEHALPVVPLYDDVVQFFARSGTYYTPTLLVSYGGPFAGNEFFAAPGVHEDVKLRRFIPHPILDGRTTRRVQYRKDEYHYPQVAASAAKILRAGGRVCAGGHGELQGLQCHWEMWALKTGGFSNFEVLRAATLHGAEALGLAQDLGSIEPGKMADLLVLARNHLDDIHHTTSIRYVMKNGELFDGDMLNQIWPQQKPLAPLWWWNEKP